jgi:hypothetical protein
VDEIDALVADLPDEIVDYIGGLQDSVEDLTKSLEDAESNDPDVVDDRDPFEKALDGLDDESAAIIKGQIDKLSELEEKVTNAERETADAEYIAKARAFDGLGDPNDLGPALRRTAELLPEDADLFEKAFAAASTQEVTATLYEELGHTISKATDVDEQIAVIAKSYQDANPALEEAEARSIAWENNPELYEEHSREQRSRSK